MLTLQKSIGMFDPENRFIFYNGLCVPKDNEGSVSNGTRLLRRCDFMIILTPAYPHFDRFDTEREER